MRSRCVILTLLVAALLPLGCEMERRVVRDGWGDLKRLADSKPGKQRNADRKLPENLGWAVVLDQFTGPDREKKATDLVRRLRAAGIPEVWVKQTNKTTTVYQGRYVDPEGIAALRALDQVHRLRIDGEAAFADAAVVPLGDHVGDVTDPINLKRHTGHFSLQIDVYDEQYEGDLRQAAERRARELRQQGHEAYYYHGPHMSMVTVGLFTWDDFTRRGTTEVYGPEIRKLQETFPRAHYNGKPMSPDNLPERFSRDAQTLRQVDGSSFKTFVVRVI